MNTQRHWIVTTDGRRAALYSCQTTPGGELHLVHVRSLENAHEHEHERHRPSMLGGSEGHGRAASGARAAPHAVAAGHGDEEEHRRFAREVGGWIESAAREIGAGHLSIFAATGFIGILRDELSRSGRTGAGATLIRGELTHLRPQQLAVHPAVLSAVGQGTSRSTPTNAR